MKESEKWSWIYIRNQINTKIWVSVSDDSWFNAVLALTLYLNTILTLTIILIFNDRPRVIKSWIIGRSFRLQRKIELFLESHPCLGYTCQVWSTSFNTFVSYLADRRTHSETHKQTDTKITTVITIPAAAPLFRDPQVNIAFWWDFGFKKRIEHVSLSKPGFIRVTAEKLLKLKMQNKCIIEMKTAIRFQLWSYRSRMTSLWA